MSTKSFVLFFIIIFFTLSLRFYTYYHNQPDLKEGQSITINTTIYSEPEIADKTQKFRVNEKGLAIYVTTSKYPLYQYGDNIHIKGKLKVFNNGDNIYYSLSFPEISKLNKSASPVISLSLFIRKRAIEVFENVLSPTQSALMLGIVFGIKRHMPDELLVILREAGVVHVIAASGMNVSLVAGSLYFVFQRFIKRRLAIIFSLFGIVVYVFIAGFEASIVRAAIIAGITCAAGLTGRQNHSIYALIITAISMLFFNPSWIFDIGFQLSFMATLGIIMLKPIFDHYLIGFRGSITDDLSTTLAAQLATLPILFSNFGSLNLLSILVNLFILWIIPILMVIGGVSIISGLIFTQLGSVISLFAIPLLIYFEIVVRWFDRFKIPLKLDNTSIVLWMGYYLVLAAVVMLLGKKIQVRKKAE